jgi:hypothetical protein
MVGTMVRRLMSFALIAVTALVLAVAGAAGPAKVVLGSKASFVPNGHGWGTAHPSAVDNGGDPTGRAWTIHWKLWGRRTAVGSGTTYLEPTTTRNWRRGRVEFRASRIGQCTAGGPRAYTRLAVRVAELHSGRFSAWQLWNGRSNLC